MSQNDSFNDSNESIIVDKISMFGTNQTNDQMFETLFSEDITDEETLMLLSTNEELPQLILDYNNYCDNKSKDHFQYTIGLINLMQKLSQIEDQVLDLWVNSVKQTENCILTTIFKLLPNCYSAVCLPKMINLSTHFEMSYYEYICSNICGFICILNEQQIDFVEQLLFENLLSKQCICYILSSDIMCFMCRQSKSPICYHFLCILFNTSLHIEDHYFPNVVSLVSRLLPFLQPLEIEYLLKDYDIISYSKVWAKIDNLSHYLSSQQINDIFLAISSQIENKSIITNEKIHILTKIFSSEQLNQQMRQNTCQLFTNNLLITSETPLVSYSIQLLSVLLPNVSNENILKLLVKMRHFLTNANMDTVLVTSKFLSYISSVQMSVSLENEFLSEMIATIEQLFLKAQHFYEKYEALTALTNIGLKSKYNTIITQCIQNQNIRQSLKQHLQKIKSNYSMIENERTGYLQNRIEYHLNGRECHQNYVMFEESSDEFDSIYISQNKRTKLSPNEVCNPFTKVSTNCNVITGNNEVIQKIDVMSDCVKSLKENRSLISTQNTKQKLMTVFYEFSDIIDRLKV